MRARRLARAGLLVVAGILLAVPGATADARGQAAPRHEPSEVLAALALDPQVQALRRASGGAVLVPTYQPQTGTWRILVQEGEQRLGTVEVDDRTLVSTFRKLRFPDRESLRVDRLGAIELARTDHRVQRELREAGDGRRGSRARLQDGGVWKVDFTVSGRTVAQALVSRERGVVRDVWTDHQIAWQMARGESGAFGRSVNAPLIWGVMCVAFALVLLVPRNLFSWHTLDVLAVLAFGISHLYFNRGEIELSVPLAVPPLVYLFVRMGWLYLGGVPAAGPSLPSPQHTPARVAGIRAWMRRQLVSWWQGGLPTGAVLVVAVFALGLRYGLNAFDANVIDVGYAGVAGADAILSGTTPYGSMPDDNEHGDTYGPLNYLLYVPATMIAGYSGSWDELPAAHGTTVAADVLCVLLLAVIGLRWLSRRGAALLVGAWATCPYVTFATSNNVNDTIVAAALLGALALLTQPWARGALVGAACAVKFVPLAVLPVICHAGSTRRLRQTVTTVAGAAFVIFACVLWVGSYDDGLARFAEATFGFQVDRDSPFSIWGLWEWGTAQRVAQAVLCLVLAAAVLVPRQRDYRQVAAGMAAALLGTQLVLQHWFYLYIPWFFAPMAIVLVARMADTRLPLSGVPGETSRTDDRAVPEVHLTAGPKAATADPAPASISRPYTSVP